jgi:hypothetical protein
MSRYVEVDAMKSIIYIVSIVSALNLFLICAFLWLFFSGRLEVRTKKLVVLDQNRVERIHLDPQSSDVRVFGKVFRRRSPASGMVLFNSKGDENGGFVILDDGTVSLTIDSYKGDKVSERVSMFVMGESGGGAGFLIKDIENRTRLKAELGQDDKLQLKIFDKAEKELKSFSFE